MILKKIFSNRLQLVLVLTLLLAACSRTNGQSPTIDNAYPSPETQPYAYPDPQVSPDENSAPGLDPLIYPPPGQATVFDSVPEDADMVRSPVTLIPDTIQVILDASPIVFLRMTVEVVDLCQQVRIIVNPPQDGKINVEMYSLAEKDNTCAQVVNQIVPTVTLGSLQPGSYELLINGESASTFEVLASP